MSVDLPPPPDPDDPGPSYGPAEFATDMHAPTAAINDLSTFRGLLEDWSGRMNLVGPSALASFWRRHALDSAQVLHVEQSARVWLDVGAGAGFPGLVLAILLKHRGAGEVHLVESMAKRITFLHTVAEALALPVRLHHARAEEVRPPSGLQVVTARACAPLPRLLAYTEHFFGSGAKGLFLKGRDVESELTQARERWTFQSHLTPSLSDPSGRVVTIERLARRGR
jgi:16S rRNA (guanine527-N7)-methyltransferase